MGEWEMPQTELLSDKQKAIFFKFYKNAKYNDLIPKKYAHMIHTAVAMAVGCSPWMEVYFGGAEEAGITEEEIAAVRAMVMAVSAGRVFYESKIVAEKMKAAGPDEAAGSECAPGCCD